MKCALVGNQNSGKTTLFNLLTGMNQTVGNWPGVTIERKEGTIRETDIQVVDLPGIYSMSPYTSEEEVSRKFVIYEKPDLIINIIDATSIERSLYLTTQLLELDAKVIIALNMSDIMAEKGVKIDVKKLEQELHTTIVSISALKKTGIDELIEKIKSEDILSNIHQRIYTSDVEDAVDFILQHHKDHHFSTFEGVKIFERDRSFSILADSEVEAKIAEVEKKQGMDSEQIIADERYNFIGKIKAKSITVDRPQITITDKIDAVILNRWLAIPIFVLVMAFVYYISVGVVGQLTTAFIDGFFNGMTSVNLFGNTINASFIGVGPWLGKLITGAGGSLWAASLIRDGIVAGVGVVLNFVPQLIVLFIFLSLLETSGYMSRIAFFLDRIFKKFGLSGKSLIPFIIGAGCSVPGIMTARTVENEKERRMTVVLTPFIPCSAKLTIIALFAGAFYGTYSWLITLSLYMFSIVIIFLSALVMKKLIYKTEDSSFISELPDYHVPSFRYVFRDVYDRTSAFIKRAGTIIFLFSVILWVLASFTWSFSYVDGQNVLIGQSMLAGIGNSLAWAFYPMLGGHWSWAAAVSAIQGLVAKEQVISSMKIISGLAEGSSEISMFNTSTFSFFNGWSAYAFMVFNLFSAPCFGAIGAMRSELGSTKRVIGAVVFQTLLALSLATLIGLIGWMVTL